MQRSSVMLEVWSCYQTKYSIDMTLTEMVILNMSSLNRWLKISIEKNMTNLVTNKFIKYGEPSMSIKIIAFPSSSFSFSTRPEIDIYLIFKYEK